MDVVKFAHQVLAMQSHIEALEREVTRLMWFEEKYNELIAAELEHNEMMMVGWMDLLLSDRITVNRPTT